MKPYILDKRVGCIAVYKSPERECLSGIERSEDCIFYAHGYLNNTDIKTAERIHKLANLAHDMYSTLNEICAVTATTRFSSRDMEYIFKLCNKNSELIGRANEVLG